MAQEITLDAIVRRSLAMRKLPLHYYFPILVFAKRGLEEMHFHVLQKAKTVTIAIDATLKTGDLPVDFVEEVMVGVEEGDKIRPIGFNPKINKRDDQGTAFPENENGEIEISNPHILGLEGAYSEYGDFRGKYFGRTQVFPDGYTIIPELNKIRIDNTSDITSVQLTYLAMPEKVSNKSLIHPFAQDTLYNWIDWQWAKYNNEPQQELRRRDYFNALRILRASKNKLTTVEIKRSVRRNIKLSIKN